jgi:hypothetical protein
MATKRNRRATTHADFETTGCGENIPSHSFTQVCGHHATLTERLPDGSLHFARLFCAICGCHLRWLPHLANVERRTHNSFRLARLAMCSKLSPWEQNFVRDVSKLRKLSPRQEAVLDRLYAQHLEGAS